MQNGQGILKTIHKKQKVMILLLERFEECLLDAEYNRHRLGAELLDALFADIQVRIDNHLTFETDYLVPMLEQASTAHTLTGLLQQRRMILSLIDKMHRLMARTQNEHFGVGAWDELIDSALSLVRETFSLFHWEEREFICLGSA